MLLDPKSLRKSALEGKWIWFLKHINEIWKKERTQKNSNKMFRKKNKIRQRRLGSSSPLISFSSAVPWFTADILAHFFHISKRQTDKVVNAAEPVLMQANTWTSFIVTRRQRGPTLLERTWSTHFSSLVAERKFTVCMNQALAPCSLITVSDDTVPRSLRKNSHYF